MQLALDMTDDGGRLEDARSRLLAAFGSSRSKRRLDPVSQLVKAILNPQSHGGTYDTVSQAAFYRLASRFKPWARLLDADPMDVAALIATVARPTEKTADLLYALKAVQAHAGHLTLDFLATLETPAALAWLQAIRGIGPETAAAVLNFSTLRRPAMVVDTHALRISQRVGWTTANASTQKAFLDWMGRLPTAWDADDITEWHWLLKALGQSFCKPKAPACLRCPVAALCKSSRKPKTVPGAAPEMRARASPAIAALRPALNHSLITLEGLSPATSFGAAPLGDVRIDGCFRLGGLPRGRWHEITADTPDPAHAAPSGFAAHLVQRAAPKGVVFWTLQRDDLYPPGLQAFGFDPGRVIFVRVDRDADALSVMENALRTKGVGAVVGEVAALDLTASKRLQLACEQWGATGFVLRRAVHATPHRTGQNRAGKRLDASSATTRWRVAPAPSVTDEPDLGPPRWQVSLERNRGGRTGAWIIEYGIMECGDAAGAVRVVSELADHAAEARVPGPPLRVRDDDAHRWRATAHSG